MSAISARHLTSSRQSWTLEVTQWKEWDMLSQLGPLFGYVPNASKTYPVVKDKFVTAARHTFSDTGIVISTDKHRHLGAALGHKDHTTIDDALLLR